MHRESCQCLSIISDAKTPDRYYNQFLSCEFAVVAAILRLSTKYQVDDFRLRAFTHLQSFYPDKWKTFASRNHDVRILNPNHYQMLSLSRECDLPVFLPAVYFLICEAMRPLPGGLAAWKEANPDFRQLSKDDLVAIFLAREELQKVAENTILRFREEYLSIEGEADQCRDCYVPVANSVFSEMTRIARVSDIFVPMVYHRIIQTVRNKYFCDACSKKYRTFFEREAEHTWGRLPDIFGFDSWHSLRNSSGLEGRNAKRITLISNWVNPIVICEMSAKQTTIVSLTLSYRSPRMILSGGYCTSIVRQT